MSDIESPTPHDSSQDQGNVAYRFCQECSNLLYPREDRQLNKLLYVCKACSSMQEHDSGCTYRTQLSANVQETAGVTTNVANDPTVGSSPFECFCTMCGDGLKCSACGEPAVDEPEPSDDDEADISTGTSQS